MKDSFELVPGVPQALDAAVTRIIAPNAGLMTGPGTNTYLVGARELIVIDPGPDDESHIQAILSAAAAPIRWILCTHTHMDHAPGASKLKQLSGAPVAAMRPPHTDHDFQLSVDRVLLDGDVVETVDVSIRALHTPGHASNHLCYLSSRMLFTGDHIMQGSTVVIWPPDGNMRAYVDSLRNLLKVDLELLAPGHGHLISDPYGELNRLIDHRLRREDKVRQAVARVGARATVESLLPYAYDDVSKSLYKWAAMSLQAHLDKLVADGELRCEAGLYG
ncbi:MAG: MBL fold metallo-hydrolase [Proteobacteria bacterium]|nr:MBL fold metallo-hydrolase [Pseudomonadota bacterium]